MKKRLFLQLQILTIILLFSAIFGCSNIIYAQDSPSNAEYETNGANYYNPEVNNIVYDFSQYAEDSSWYFIQYPYAKFLYYNTTFSVSSYIGPNQYYSKFIVCNYPFGFGFASVYFTEPIHNLSFSVVGGDGGTFKVDIYKNRVLSQTLTFPASYGGYSACFVDLRSHTNVTGVDIHSINDDSGLGFDDFSFKLGAAPPATRSPIGNLDGVTDEGFAHGWSLDLDAPTQPNTILFYIDGGLVGSTVANEPSPNIGYPGSHKYNFPIPSQFRDGTQHTISAYGLDVVGDNPRTLLTSPRTFTLSPVVQSTTFIELPESPLTMNPNDGGGLRIFPDKLTPDESTTTIRHIVKVKAKITSNTAGVNVYFQSFDLDEPSSDTLPIDTNGNNSGGDNRSGSFSRGQFGCPEEDCDITPNNVFVVPTNANGEATIQFSVKSGHPGDNYAVAASTKETDLIDANVATEGLNIRNTVSNKTFQIDKDRTKMLTVWRRLHIEVDSMSVVQGNYNIGRVDQAVEVGTEETSIQVRRSIKEERFQNGLMFVGNNVLYVDNNTSTSITAHSFSGTVYVPFYAQFTLYDDDDFNSNSPAFGYEGDNGEDVTALDDSFNLLRENDDKDCSDGDCNVFAAAYIRPEYIWANPYNSSNIPFVLNVLSTNSTLVTQQIDIGRYSNSGENDDFWVVYAQIDYQGSTEFDCDPNTELCSGGVTVRDNFFFNVVRRESEVPEGSQGSLIFIESVRDVHTFRNKARIKTIPHEMGHQFGIAGDESLSEDCGLMCYSNGLTSMFSFSDEHLNMIRWRRKSPGQP